MCESQMILVKITKLIYHFICISNYIKFDSHSSDEWHFNVKCRTLETEVLNAPDACSFARCSLQICNMHLVKYFIQKIFVSVVVFVRWLFLLLLLSSCVVVIVLSVAAPFAWENCDTLDLIELSNDNKCFKLGIESSQRICLFQVEIHWLRLDG